MFGIPGAVFAAFMTGAVAWGELDLPRPAWHSELQILELQVAANTAIIQGNLWLRLTSKIKTIEDKLKGGVPAEERRAMINELVVLQLQLREVNGKLK